MLPSSVSEYLRAHQQPALEKLMEWLRIPSVANDKDSDACQRAAEWLRAYLEELGLEAQVVPTSNKPNVIASARVDESLPTLLIYGHYDVQPADPLELWQSDPFRPEVRDGCLYARGASDDKGQFFTHLMAIEAFQRGAGGLPVNLKVFVEGEEEIGSPDLEPFMADRLGQLEADGAVISDGGFFAEGLPSIMYSLRGLVYVEVTFRGPERDLHSGQHGGAVMNPINALAKLVAAMHDASGRVTVPGFYDDVVELTDAERAEWAALPFDEQAYAKSLGVEALSGGEQGLGVLERRWGRPTLDCNGIVGGYGGVGAKTIIPASASAKISMRLVPDQVPEKIVAGFKRFVAEHTPPGIRAEVEVHAGARPLRLARDSAAMEAARRAYLEAFGRLPAMIGCGASVPIGELFQRLLGLDVVLLSFGLPDDNVHSPNERFRLDQLYRGAVAAAAFMHHFGRAG